MRIRITDADPPGIVFECDCDRDRERDCECERECCCECEGERGCECDCDCANGRRRVRRRDGASEPAQEALRPVQERPRELDVLELLVRHDGGGRLVERDDRGAGEGEQDRRVRRDEEL